MQPNEIEIAYTAGLFDGEGSFAAYVGGGANRTSLVYKTHIWQSRRQVLDWVHSRFGGLIVNKHAQGKTSFRSNKDQVYWVANGKAAYEFITCIRPYMIVRAEDADLFIRIWEVRLDLQARFEAVKTWKDSRPVRNVRKAV